MRINVGLVTEVIISPDIDPGEILKLLRFDFVSKVLRRITGCNYCYHYCFGGTYTMGCRLGSTEKICISISIRSLP